MKDSPQRHRVHRDIKFITLPRDVGKAIPSAASRNTNLLYALCASVVNINSKANKVHLSDLCASGVK